MREALSAWLIERCGEGGAIDELRRIATGNSRAMWFVRTIDGSRFVARVEQGGVFGTSSTEEFEFMRAARRLGCPVAEVRWFESTDEVIGAPFFVMDFVDGAATGRDDRSMSPALARDFVTQLHRLHQTDFRAELPTTLTAADATHAQIDRWADVYRRASALPVPLLEEGVAWLHQHAPAARSIGIVHGDPGPGNFVHDGERVLAITDWEFSHLGDPTEDWAYLVSMRGNRTMSPAEWVALFDDVAGVQLDERTLHYWSTFNYFKGACANLTCLGVFRTTNPAPNMAIIGTALHETFLANLARQIGDAP